jgi:hypothetical protein
MPGAPRGGRMCQNHQEERMTSHKRLLTAIVTGAMALTGLAAGAGAASAAPAVFNTTAPSSSWYHTAPLIFTVTNNVTGVVVTTITCEANATGYGGAVTNSGSPLQGHIISQTYDYARLRCGDDQGNAYQALFTQQQLNAEKNGTSFSLTSPFSLKVNFIGYNGFAIYGGPNVAFSVPFINGTGSTGLAAVSRVVYSNTLVGYRNHIGYDVRLTGTFYLGGITRLS